MTPTIYAKYKQSEQLALEALTKHFPEDHVRLASSEEDKKGTDLWKGPCRVQVKHQKAAERYGRFSFEVAVLDRHDGWKQGNHYSVFDYYMLTSNLTTWHFIHTVEIDDLISNIIGDIHGREPLSLVGNYPEGLVVRSLSYQVKLSQLNYNHRHLDAVNVCIPLQQIEKCGIILSC
jgi:hypothetical protein